MIVKDIMTTDVHCVGSETNLAAAATIMWDSDCGVLPVLNAQGRVTGMITDRDICMAAATKNKPASDITVRETVTGTLHTCHMADDVHTALDLMRRQKVHRLPVVDDEGGLQGIVSMNDFILAAEEGKGKKAPAISYEDVMEAMKAISAHRILVGI